MKRITPFSRAALAAAAVLSLGACSPEPAPDAEPAPDTQAAPAAQPQAQAQPQGTPQQPASPRDTAEMAFAGERIYVDYGRPYMRGRTIMGGLVPYGRVWRTGANAATTFVTPRDVRIGETLVPAGTYTLYTLPGEQAWQLIVNKQTGQWGTQYDPAQDLTRIPMKVERTAAPVEQFTISLVPGTGLVMEWENTRVSVPIQPATGGA
ncbi:DUF2911 domain-containing protein [Longimicrobium sp.]|uniref:DUF2911 domain-containing protein n=1 Tax=Longimicrobium sp. TaxID=2029185 RepID=UPI002E302495|nr:DUF2911 domain-containing protein [Longimicrobium sp.]HEX6040158.1 DUF2911 domain-containing protein [Longimicrobium sp.]